MQYCSGRIYGFRNDNNLSRRISLEVTAYILAVDRFILEIAAHIPWHKCHIDALSFLVVPEAVLPFGCDR
jgi:hypothetical protein